MADVFGTTDPNDLRGTGGDDSLMGCAPDFTLQSTDPSPATDNDTLDGRAGNDRIEGMNGDDLLYGGLGDDTLEGGQGSDVMYGGLGDDCFYDPYNGNQAYGGDGNDTFDTGLGFDGMATTLDGGSGLDTLNLSFGWGGGGIVFAMPGPDTWATLQGGSQIFGVEVLYAQAFSINCTLIGGAFDDTLQAFGDDQPLSRVDSALFGGGGDDYLLMWGPGPATLSGGVGNDRLTTDAAGDVSLFGGEGDDQVWLTDGRDRAGPLFADGGSGLDRISFELPDADHAWRLHCPDDGETLVLTDDFILTGFEEFHLSASQHDDRLWGGRNDDGFYGGGGNDWLRGGEGDDASEGGYGKDTLYGGAGSDTLTGPYSVGEDDLLFGGAGRDMLILNGGVVTGGKGADIFKFAYSIGPHAPTTIADFSGGDTFLLDQYRFPDLPLLHLPGADFVQGTTAQDASDRFLYDQTTGALWYDPDGTGSDAATLMANLTPSTTLTERDFLIL